MAYMRGGGVSGLAGLVGAGLGGYLGYTQAVATELPPVQGALALGLAGLVLGSAGAFILKSLVQFLIYVLIIAAMAFVFRDQIEGATGIDPVEATLNVLRGWGVPI